MTLVELLIVITIIAVIAVLSISVLMRTRRRAYLATCISNLRQLVQAVHIYESDWGVVPVEKPIKTLDGVYEKARQVLDPYVKDNEVLLRPSDFTRGRLAYLESYTKDITGDIISYRILTHKIQIPILFTGRADGV